MLEKEQNINNQLELEKSTGLSSQVQTFVMPKSLFINRLKGFGLVKKSKGRWGTIHYQLGHIENHYQKIENHHKIFDSEEQALEYLYNYLTRA